MHFLTLLRGLTPSRVWNAFLLRCSYTLSRWLKRPIIWGKPIAISVEPTTSCNLRCPECPSGLRSFTRPTGMLDESLFQRILDQVSSHVSFLTFYFQGEPFLHPRFLALVKQAKSKGIYVSTSTNAHYLSPAMSQKVVESGLDRMTISIDGITPEVYRQYRVGGQLDKVLEGAKNMVEARKNAGKKAPYLVFQFLVVKPNEHQIEDAKKLCLDLGIDEIVFKSAQIYDYENGSPLIPDNSQFSRYRKVGDKYIIKNKFLNQCWKMWHSCVFTWDGMVVPCCFDKDAEHPMGKISEQEFTSIWKGNSYQNFRKAILQSRSKIDICKNCTEGTKVWVQPGEE